MPDPRYTPTDAALKSLLSEADSGAMGWVERLAAVEAIIDARVAAERERIAQAIEAVRSHSLGATEVGHLDHAARIARGVV